MDVLIKNMEMPKDCYECRFHSMQNVMHKACVIHLCYAQEIGQSCNEGEVPTKLHDGCPLVALQEYHGRLIDADALIKKTRMWSLVRGDEYFELRVNNAIVKELLDAVPTIVEANNGSDN